MSLPERFCEHGGLVVSGTARVPADPCEFKHPAIYAPIGCSRLRCTKCGSWVRQQAGVHCNDDARLHLDEMASTKDWTVLPYMATSVRTLMWERLYACRCTAWLEVGGHYMEEPDFDPDRDPVLPWRCAGHPAPALPVELNGVILGPDTDWSALIRRIRYGWFPVFLANGEREGPAVWLAWLYSYLSGLPEADALSRAAACLMSDDDARIRGMVLFLFERFPTAEGIEQVVSAAYDKPDRAVTRMYHVPEAVAPHRRSLLDVITARVRSGPNSTDPVDLTCLRILQRLMLSPVKGVTPEHIETMVRLHGEWTARNAAGIVRVHPNLWRPLMDAFLVFGQPAQVAMAGVSIATSGVVPESRLRRWLALPPNQGQPWTLAIEAALGAA